MSNQGDWSWSDEALYACPCGSLVPVRRWRWLDRQARPDLVPTLRAHGPLVGACSRCRRPVTAGGAWLEVDPDRGAATLVLSADRRGDLITALQAHLADLQARPEQAAPWLLQPAIAFVPVPPPWAEESGEAPAELSPWPGPPLEEAGLRAPQVEVRPGAAAAASAGAGREGRGEETGLKGHVPGDRAADGEPGRRREGSGPTAVVAAPTRREGSEPKAEGPGPSEADGSRSRPGRDGSAAEGSGPPEADSRLSRRGMPPADASLHDTMPGRRRARAGDPALEAVVGGSPGAPRRPAATLTPAEAAGVSAGTGRDGPPRPGAVLAASELAGAARDRRPSAMLEGTGTNGQDASGMSAGTGAAKRPSAPNEAPEPAGRDRRPSALLEGAGSNGQDSAAMSAGEAAPEEAEPERSTLREAVARALSPGAPTPNGKREGEATIRPAAVLPGPGTEAGTAESSGAWSRRLIEAAETASRRHAGERQVNEAAETGTWSKRQVLEDDGAAPRREDSAAPAAIPPPPPRREDSGTPPPLREDLASAPRDEGEGASRGLRGRTPTPPPLRLGPEVQRAGLGTLAREGATVQVTAPVNEATARAWLTAPVRARPVHLRGLGYPLVGVRLVAEAGGESLVLDAVVDVGEPATLDLFKQLTREFKVRLQAGGHSRELTEPELRRNAAACLESAQAQLGTGEFPPDAYRTARELLAGLNAAQRLEPARAALPESLIEGCRESAAAAWAALERLDLASRKDNLSRLLEVDGLGIETYEKIRSTVLQAAIEFGLPAPGRFWRRWLGSDPNRDGGTFVQKLIAARTASIARGEDLAPEQVEAAWRGILDLCQHKNLTPPPELSKALGLGKVATGRRASQPQLKATAEVREAPAQEARSRARLRELAARLRGSPADGDIRAAFAALPELAEADVVSLMPGLAELGSRVLPELLSCLRAPQRHVRQAAAILLGYLGERKAEGPLVAMLGDEPTAAWVDAARALGNLGPRVVGPLCALLRGAPPARREGVGARVARALAELIRAEGAGLGGAARVAVENLLEVGDPSVSSAARRALATLGAVRDEADGDDAEAARRFSRLASDAIAPELDAEDDEIDEVEVEVGD